MTEPQYISKAYAARLVNQPAHTYIEVWAYDIHEAEELMAKYYPHERYSIRERTSEDFSLDVYDRIPYPQQKLELNEKVIHDLQVYGIDYKEDEV